MFFIQKFFHKLPTIWFPPWNKKTDIMQMAAHDVGLTIDNESEDIKKFVREVVAGSFHGHSVYFHGWNQSEMEAFPQMLELANQITY